MQSHPSTQVVSPGSARLRERQRTPSVGQALQCHICSRSYERADHLHRHLDSRV